MSPALRSMQRAMVSVISSFEAMDAASSNSVDTSAIRQARDELARAEIALDSVEQNIREADEQQQKFNKDVRNCGDEADSLKSKFMGFAGALGVAFSAKKVLELADSMTQTTARLDLMNDGLQTTEELQNKIMASANRSRAAYTCVSSTFFICSVSRIPPQITAPPFLFFVLFFNAVVRLPPRNVPL